MNFIDVISKLVKHCKYDIFTIIMMSVIFGIVQSNIAAVGFNAANVIAGLYSIVILMVELLGICEVANKALE